MTYEMLNLHVVNLIISIFGNGEKITKFYFSYFSFFEKNVKLIFSTKKSLGLIETCLEIQTLFICLFFSNIKSSKLKHG
jgi:hypothetical protein